MSSSSSTLSYGDRKRVELARALCAEPGAAAARRAGRGDERATSRRTWHVPSSVVRERARASRSSLVEHDMALRHGHCRPRDGARLRPTHRGRHRRTRCSAIPRCSRAYLGATERQRMNQLLDAAAQRLVAGLHLRAHRDRIRRRVQVDHGCVNFAHGSILLLGAYVVGRTHDELGFALAALAGIAAAAVAAALIERVIMRPLRAAADLGTLAILTLGVDILHAHRAHPAHRHRRADHRCPVGRRRGHGSATFASPQIARDRRRSGRRARDGLRGRIQVHRLGYRDALGGRGRRDGIA